MIKLKSLIESKWPKNLSKVWAFWMSPEGELFEVPDDGGHDYMAREFLKNRYNITFDERNWYNHDLRQLLYNRGWKDVSPTTIKDQYRSIFISPKKSLTPSQKRTIEKLSMESGRSVYYDDMNFTPILILPGNDFR